MIKAVLDVNVLVSGFPAPGGTPASVIALWVMGQFELVLSDHILDGIARAWANPYYRSRYTRAQAEQAFTTLRKQAKNVTPDPAVRGICDDEEDDLVLATAVAGRVSHLVTGDKGLLRIGSFDSIAIVTPREFLALFPRRNGAR